MQTVINKILIAAIAFAACLSLQLCFVGDFDAVFAQWSTIVTLGALATSFSGGPSVRDNTFKATLALPSAASTTVNQATFFDTEASGLADFVMNNVEFLISAPAVNTTMAPDTKTMTYNIVASTASNGASPTVVGQSVVVQTGAGGAGAAAATGRWKAPSNIGATGRYIGLQIVSGANTTNAASVSGTLEMLF